MHGIPAVPKHLAKLHDVMISSTEPTTRDNGDPLEVNDLWLDTGLDPKTWNVWDGTAWQAMGGSGSSGAGVWMPLTSVVSGEPVLVWDDDDSLIPTEVPT